MILRSTHTFATLEVSPAAYDEIQAKLTEAGYSHAFVDGAIDMHGIGLTRESGKAKANENPTTAPDLEAKRAQAFVEMLVFALKKARRIGGANAKMHLGDVLDLAERFQRGAMDAKFDAPAPVTGPFYPRGHP